MDRIIKNFDLLAKSRQRKLALEIVEAGLRAINTEKVIQDNLKLKENRLIIKSQAFDLEKFNKIYVIGFGKTSCDAIIAIDKILSTHISTGIAIDIKTAHCENPNIKVFKGSHPKPTPDNLIATNEILELAKKITKDDLVLCIVSGGGSSLLCADENECINSNLIFDEILKSGGDIYEMNILRKHISSLKGGGLAKLFFPATILGLIFSDIPGGENEFVASGPTFQDISTLADVRKIITKRRLNLKGVHFIETPKEEKYFKNVSNFLIVSNKQAIEAMENKARELGLNPIIQSDKLMEKVELAAKMLATNLESKQVLLAGGEPRITSLTGKFGKGGRNLQLTLEALPYLLSNQVFISIASDGVDNTDAAGAIADDKSYQKITNYEEIRASLDSYPVFEKMNDLIFTGPTGSNVADLMVSLRL